MAENTPLIYKKIIEVMADINAIGKDRRNQQQGFQFRGIDDVMNELHSSLAKCGVFVLPNVLEETRTTGKTKNGGDMFYTRLKINFGFYAEDGTHVDAVVIGEAMDTGDKASNKALSIGLKYAMLQVFCIPTEDDKDPDAHSPQFEEIRLPDGKAEVKKRPAAKFDFEPKGGETTPAEKKEIGGLLASKYPNGAPVFSTDEAKKYSAMRKDYTAREVIDAIKKELQARLNPTQQMQTAGDMMRAQQEQQLPPEVAAVKEAVNGEVVEQQDAIF
ncbi:MAG: ERF family protein [Bacteroidaceae bacterium]|nr:ERF family protein [Bacteroidaceae bacterium]